MSIERVPGNGTLKWRVRWRDESGSAHSKRTRTKRQAERLDAKIKEAKAVGDLGLLSPSNEVLHEFVTQRWLPNYASSNYERSTLQTKVSQWNAHINPVLGNVRLRDLSTEHIDALAANLSAEGLAPLTRRSILVTLQSMLEVAVKWGHLTSNPAREVRKPPRKRMRDVRPVTPTQVEQIRDELEPRGRLLVSLTAYAGIRPGEFRKLTWDSVRQRTLHIPSDIAKTGTSRTVRLFSPVADDLEEWRALRPASPTDLIVVGRGGVPVSHPAYGRWRDLNFNSAAQRAGVEVVFYDLRHSFVSLLIQSGAQILDIARQAGHRPTETLETYGHLFEEYAPEDRVDPERAILEARSCPQSVRPE